MATYLMLAELIWKGAEEALCQKRHGPQSRVARKAREGQPQNDNAKNARQTKAAGGFEIFSFFGRFSGWLERA
jgi:hypothetical protein